MRRRWLAWKWSARDWSSRSVSRLHPCTWSANSIPPRHCRRANSIACIRNCPKGQYHAPSGSLMLLSHISFCRVAAISTHARTARRSSGRSPSVARRPEDFAMAEINKLSVGQALDKLRRPDVQSTQTRLDEKMDALDKDIQRMRAINRRLERDQRAAEKSCK